MRQYRARAAGASRRSQDISTDAGIRSLPCRYIDCKRGKSVARLVPARRTQDKSLRGSVTVRKRLVVGLERRTDVSDRFATSDDVEYHPTETDARGATES